MGNCRKLTRIKVPLNELFQPIHLYMVTLILVKKRFMPKFLKLLFSPFSWYFNLFKKSKVKFAVVTFTISFFCLFGGLLGFYYSVSGGIFGKLPSDKELKELQNYQASEVYSADSVLLGRYFVENRTEVTLQEVPPLLIKSLIATEDARFYTHTGVDNRSLMRVLFK